MNATIVSTGELAAAMGDSKGFWLFRGPVREGLQHSTLSRARLPDSHEGAAARLLRSGGLRGDSACGWFEPANRRPV